MSSYPHDDGRRRAQYSFPYMNVSAQADQARPRHVPLVVLPRYGGVGSVVDYYPEMPYTNQEYLAEAATNDLSSSLNTNYETDLYSGSQAIQSHSNVPQEWDPSSATGYYQGTDATTAQGSYIGNGQPRIHDNGSSHLQLAPENPEANEDSSSEEDNDETYDARQRGATSRRICCPYVIKDPHMPPPSAACWNTGFQNVSRLKQHLKRNHEIIIPYQERGTTEEEKFQNVWKTLYPDDTEVPTPFGWNKETLRRQQNLRVIQEHEDFIRMQFRQHCPNENVAYVLESILVSFHQTRGADLLPL